MRGSSAPGPAQFPPPMTTCSEHPHLTPLAGPVRPQNALVPGKITGTSKCYCRKTPKWYSDCVFLSSFLYPPKSPPKLSCPCESTLVLTRNMSALIYLWVSISKCHLNQGHMQGSGGMIWSITIVPDDPPGRPWPAPPHMTTSEPFASGISQYVGGITASDTDADSNLGSATYLLSDLRQVLRIAEFQFPGPQSRGKCARVP